MKEMFLVHLNAVGNFHLVHLFHLFHLFHFVVVGMMVDVLQNLDEQNLGADQTFPHVVHLYQNLVHLLDLLDVVVDVAFHLLKRDYFLHVVQVDVVHQMDYFQDVALVLMDVARLHLTAQKVVALEV